MNICFIDFETTGANPLKDKPLEIGAVLATEDCQIIKTFSSYINPGGEINISDTAQKIHQIDIDTVRKADIESKVLKNLFDNLGTNYRFAAWNVNFDVTFMRNICNKNNFTSYYNQIYYRHIDVQSLSFLANQMNLYGKELNSLTDVAHYFGIDRSNKHSALEDSIVLLKVYKQLIHLFKKQLVTHK
jgi:DNA polymerase III epsilon subunit-like protein